MKIKSLKWKNFMSYGNKIQELKFNDSNDLILLFGNSGNGKCVSKDTIINIEIDDPSEKLQFIDFLNNYNNK